MPQIHARFAFHPDDPGHAAARIQRGCVVTVNGATVLPGTTKPREYLVYDVEDDAGLAYLARPLGRSGTFDADYQRVARIDDLALIRGVAQHTPQHAAPTAPVTPSGPAGAARDRASIFPPEVIAAYRVIQTWAARCRGDGAPEKACEGADTDLTTVARSTCECVSA